MVNCIGNNRKPKHAQENPISSLQLFKTTTPNNKTSCIKSTKQKVMKIYETMTNVKVIIRQSNSDNKYYILQEIIYIYNHDFKYLKK